LGAENLEGLKDLLGLNTSKKRLGEFEEDLGELGALYCRVLGAENLEGLKDLLGLNTSKKRLGGFEGDLGELGAIIYVM
jgi:hypothetical protein